MRSYLSDILKVLTTFWKDAQLSAESSPLAFSLEKHIYLMTIKEKNLSRDI